MCMLECLQTKCGQADGGQRPIIKPHLSNQRVYGVGSVSIVVCQCSITRKTAPPPCQPYIYKTNLFTKFHDWTKNVTSRVSHIIQLTGTIFELNSHIKETNVLTKFHENLAKNVTSRVFTCFHYIHIEKNAPPTGGHVFSRITDHFRTRPRYQLNQLLSRKTAPPTGGHVFQWTGTTFELNQHII
ncbi:hypothetical protein DPMN_109723 [Dreissena polymorpha]|uniref:Uncharacterized protein n=1 Tax=Dreissena polymorpha TaxID=45954 RepID=A0A9D4QMA1_DREPO|nr:hypothetical protein DPMN_109723 [Dreissena polymorpha]